MSNLISLVLKNINRNISPSSAEVKSWRLRNSLNTQDAAKLLGVSKRTWERYESGARQIDSSSWAYLNLLEGQIPGARILVLGE